VSADAAAESPAPEPEEIYQRTEEEGRRRLQRPFAELVSTALAAGVDIVLGIVALTVTAALVDTRGGSHLAHLAGALAFGISFVFIVVGRSELFTENFLVPVAGLDRTPASWYKLAELWTISPIFNIVGGGLLILVVTGHGVLPVGTKHASVVAAMTQDERGWTSAFLSAIAAGALITLMTWLVEGSRSMGIRVAVAWICGTLLALGAFNHVIVVTLELIMGIRFGAPVGWGDVVDNFFTAGLGNMVGGLLVVTLNRFNQARQIV
jgi:formate/nitrite transporter FocA (FNT family)